MKKIGFIGVGIMGKSMVRNLMKAGFELHIYARTRSKVEDVISEGAIFHETIADCVKDCDAVITIVGFPVDVEEVYFDKGNILDSAKEGAYLIDMTTTSPMLDQKIAEEGTKRGFHVLDAPVTGGDTGAKAGTLSILVGGSREDYEACMPLFKAMGTNINYQGAAGSLSIVIQSLSAIIYTPVMLRLLGQNEYGLYQLGSSAVSYLSLLSFGFNSSYVKFYFEYKVKGEEEKIRRLNSIFLLVFCCLAIVSCIVGGVMIASANLIFNNSLSPADVHQVRILMFVLVLSTALTFPNIIFDCYITAHEKYIFQRLILIGATVLLPILTLPLLYMGYKSTALVAVNLFISVFRTVMNVYYCFVKLEMKFQFHGMQLKVLKNVSSFSIFIFLNEIASQINWNVDKVILGAVQGASVVAVYSVGSQFNQYFINMSTAVSNVFIPRVNKMVAERQGDDALTALFIKIGRVQYVVLSAILGGYLLYGKFFIMKWAGEGYDAAYYVGALVMIPAIIPLIQNIGIEIQKAKNMHKFRSIVYFIIAFANLGISVPLGKYYGAIGAAFGTTLATVVGNIILMNWYYQTKIGLNIKAFFKSMIRPTIVLIIAYMEGLLVKSFFAVDSWFDFISQGAIFICVYGILLYRWGFNQEEKENVRRMFKRN